MCYEGGQIQEVKMVRACVMMGSSKNRGQPPPEVGDQTANWVEEWPVERDTWIPKSGRPFAVEDD